MTWLLFGIFLGILIGLNMRPTDTTDYSKIDFKLRQDLSVAQNLNNSLKTDLSNAKEELWKLKQEKINGNPRTKK